jgi:hypothetical protein
VAEPVQLSFSARPARASALPRSGFVHRGFVYAYSLEQCKSEMAMTLKALHDITRQLGCVLLYAGAPESDGAEDSATSKALPECFCSQFFSALEEICKEKLEQYPIEELLQRRGPSFARSNRARRILRLPAIGAVRLLHIARRVGTWP